MTQCMFNGCTLQVQEGSTKCSAHRNRTKCDILNCPNQAYTRGVCVRHGAKRNCAVSQCQLNRRFGSYCSKHADATQKKQCETEGCKNQAHARGKCVRHGGGHLCKADGCHRHARLGGFCSRHSVYVTISRMQLGAPKAKPDHLDLAILQDLVSDVSATSTTWLSESESQQPVKLMWTL
ncbi:hypothetical protein Ae201684P_019323 [Aphanomyces euteiches]|uniref:WRKY transcription factor 19 n=1 Tax=Aphanomyces euteiches TaxID=100861 RepID=A0A6G0XE91_9STRA|nr:hypothetical protein Ae201684_005636 [Aphanomyces euteiches]KAH9078232.1 hypothetical protein Ae201684P_019323 [Aphanomyces euteiches]KAH9142904.1 hypothetical protein AeRB84_013068 [Aphanomyces euteiches]